MGEEWGGGNARPTRSRGRRGPSRPRPRASRTTPGGLRPAQGAAGACPAGGKAKAIVKVPVAAYVEKVYEEGVFAALGIGT